MLACKRLHAPIDERAAMNLTKRITALLLALILIIGLTACEFLQYYNPAKSPIPVPTPTVTPDLRTLPPPSTPVPTRDISMFNDAQNRLAALDMEIFEEYVTGDPLSFKLAIKRPENFDFKTPENTWGDISFEAIRKDAQMETDWLKRLDGIGRTALDFDEQLTYDTLRQHLELSIALADYFYYDEPLSPYNGIHTNIPFNLALYPLDSEADVENYLALLADTPRFIGQLLEFEREKSRQGLFMPVTALEMVLEQLDEFIAGGDKCFLIGTFAEALGKLGGISGEKASEYAKQNEQGVKALITSYRKLRAGLDELRDACADNGGMWAFGEDGVRAFELGLKYAACSDITPDEAYDLIYDELINEYTELLSAVRSSPGVFDIYGTIDLDLGSLDENLNCLESLTAQHYPPVPKHAVRFLDVPKDLESQFSPAAYLVPPVDSTDDNLIIINRKTLNERANMLITLAHEGYPGHMYHYLYMRSILTNTGYTRQALALTGYAEAMSVSAELFFARYNAKFSNDYCLLTVIDANIGNLLIPALCAIGVHHYKWTTKDIADFLIAFMGGDSADEMAKIYYEFCLNDPFYTLEYAAGFAALSAKRREAAKILRDKFSLLEFNKAFLDLGPSYFNLINERLDKWVNRKKG